MAKAPFYAEGIDLEQSPLKNYSNSQIDYGLIIHDRSKDNGNLIDLNSAGIDAL